jgi:hypothetical protein
MGIVPHGAMQSFVHAFQETHMSKRLPAALTAAALCTLFGALHAQTTDAPDPTGQERYQLPSGTPASEPAEALPSSTPTVSPPIVYETSVPINREMIPSSRTDVQSDTRAAMRARAIPRGELSTPEQDKGSDRALAPFERGMAPNDYAH